MNKNGRAGVKYPFRDGTLTISQMMAINTKYIRGKIQLMLKAGVTAEEIAYPELFCKKTKQAIAKAKRDQIKADKVTIKRAKADEMRKRAKVIMSVPINPEKTAEHYIMKAFTHRASSNLGEAIRLRSNGHYDV
tara:strand:+ start:461 stop:862 length:402 start_codon:yes stop_codon:yes gene_type:complete